MGMFQRFISIGVRGFVASIKISLRGTSNNLSFYQRFINLRLIQNYVPHHHKSCTRVFWIMSSGRQSKENRTTSSKEGVF